MKHGENISLDEAKRIIRKYVDDQVASTGRPESETVVGHKFDLALMKAFIAEIDRLIQEGKPIDSIRVYHAKSKRGTLTSEESDLVMVPTHSADEDHHRVYEPLQSTSPEPAIIGHSTPCPNVCSKKLVSCP